MEERRLRNDDSPNGLLYETFTSTAFRAHPYGIPTIGWESDILSLTPADDRGLLQSLLWSRQCDTMAIVGDINPKEVIDPDRARHSARSRPRLRCRPLVTVEPPQRGERRVEVEFDAEPSLAIGYHKPAIGPSR